MDASDEMTDRASGTILLVSVAFLGLVLSRIDGPWWMRATGVVAMIVLVWTGSRMVFFRRDRDDPTTDSEASNPDRPK